MPTTTATLTPEEFVATRQGRYIYLFDDPNQGHECMNVFWDWNRTVGEAETYSADVAADLALIHWATYDLIPPDQELVYGDVCTWAGDWGAYQNWIPSLGRGAGHVAVWLADYDGASGWFLSQNPNACQVMLLSYDGIQGYLRLKPKEGSNVLLTPEQLGFRLETQWDSPNYTPAALVPTVPGWPGVPRTIESITIHHWNEPGRGDTYQSTINTLTGNTGKSAHFVVETGRAASLISLENASWANGNGYGNATSVTLELNPDESDGTYRTAAGLIRFIRDLVGDVPLVPHSFWTSTACPGGYDLNRLDTLARSFGGPAVVAPKEIIPGLPGLYALAA